MKLKTNNPNFSIVVPSICDSKCPFCFGNTQECSLGKEKYLKNLKQALKSLPDAFKQISITGGEPTLSPWLDDILGLIDKKRFIKVVLTTSATKNGDIFKLKNISKINHINISRHSINDQENIEIFNNGNIPNSNDLKEIVSNLNDMGIDVTLNCVLGDKSKSKVTAISSLSSKPLIDNKKFKQWVHDYIQMAKDVNASAVAFRKRQDKYSDLNPTIMEMCFDNVKVIEESSCPVCRSKSQIIDGVKVVWRASLFEPSNTLKGIYELIFQPNTKVTSDWLGQNVVDPNSIDQTNRSINSSNRYVSVPHCGNISRRCG